MAEATPERPWHEAFPPTSMRPDEIPSMTRQEVLSLLKSNSVDLKTVVVDLRRADYVGGYIQGSLNVPAQSMYYCMPTLYELFEKSGINTIVWFCGSSRGRGPRAAGWFHDYLRSRNDVSMRSVVLEGGIKGWVAAGGEYIDWMGAFEPELWKDEDHKAQ